MKNPFKIFNKYDIALWVTSVVAIVLSFALSPSRDYLTLISSITGVSALMYIAKGNVIGQFITVVFAILYGVVSYYFSYYGEMITYLGMTAPAAIAAIISWLRHPYNNDHSQVAIGKLTKIKAIVILLLTGAVTTAFYFILRELDTANLIVSTVSVATSFVASCLTFLRSPFYGLAYGANDIVLIIMWVLACIADISYLPMVICFALFFIYDVYGFINWTRMRKNQHEKIAQQNENKIEPETPKTDVE